VDTKHRNKYAETTDRQSSNFLGYLGAYKWISSCPRIYTGSKVKPDGYTYTHTQHRNNEVGGNPSQSFPRTLRECCEWECRPWRGAGILRMKIVCEEGRILEVNSCCHSTGEAENSSVGGVGERPSPSCRLPKGGPCTPVCIFDKVFDIWHTKTNLPKIRKMLVNWHAQLRIWHVVCSVTWEGKNHVSLDMLENWKDTYY